MTALIVAAVFVLLVLVVLVVWEYRRRRPEPQPSRSIPTTNADDVDRHQQLDEVGSALIERRVELDKRRGMLGGDQNLDQALLDLDEQYRRGDMEESEFEREKIRLLSGLY